MDPHVVFQLLLLREHNLKYMNVIQLSIDKKKSKPSFPNLTNWTSSPFLPSVGSLVTVARSLVAESHLAELALVRLDPQVDPDMPLQVTLLDKLLGTVWTLVPWTNVDQHVLVEAVPAVKFLPTVVTLVLFFALVTHPVVVEAGLGDKRQAADRTNVGVGVGVVHLVVKTPSVGRFQNLVANLAYEPLLCLVRVTSREVGLQGLSAGKLLLAHFARVTHPLLTGVPVLPDVCFQGLLVLQLGRTVRALETHSLWMFSPHVTRQQLSLWEEKTAVGAFERDALEERLVWVHSLEVPSQCVSVRRDVEAEKAFLQSR